MKYIFSIDGEDVRVMLWVFSLKLKFSTIIWLKKFQDTAGQEEFDAITKAYYRGAQACVLTFSTTDRCSFEAIKDWKKKVENECGEIPTVLVQNKIDLMDQTLVSL
jgi:Ras-related protein Rab-23